MARRSPTSTYFADDRDIFDLLNAAKQKLTAARLVDLARSRGIVLSPEDSRERLASEIALMPFSWRELSALIHSTDTVDRTERMTSRIFDAHVSVDNLKAALEIVRTERDRGEVFECKETSGGYRIVVAYSELDTSRHRLAQRTKREFTLDFDIETGGRAVVRHQDQSRAYDLLEALVEQLRPPSGQLGGAVVELSGIKSAALRVEFFMKLIASLPGFTKVTDAKSIKTSRFSASKDPKGAEGNGDDEADETEAERVSDEDEDEDEEPISPDEARLIAHVREVALKGTNLLSTAQYQHLVESGYFVRAMVWVAESKDARVEFEAGFANGEAGTGFGYSVKAYYPRKDKSDEFRRSKAAPDTFDKTKLLRLLEDAAQTALAHVVSRAMAGDDQPLLPFPADDAVGMAS